MYEGAEIPEPVIGDWSHFLDSVQGGESAAFGNFGSEHAVESRKHYYANITFIDEMVGEIIQALKEKGMYENSIICFTSDHGDMLGDHHHWRKTYAYEGSSNIPFILTWSSSFSIISRNAPSPVSNNSAPLSFSTHICWATPARV